MTGANPPRNQITGPFRTRPAKMAGTVVYSAVVFSSVYSGRLDCCKAYRHPPYLACIDTGHPICGGALYVVGVGAVDPLHIVVS